MEWALDWSSLICWQSVVLTGPDKRQPKLDFHATSPSSTICSFKKTGLRSQLQWASEFFPKIFLQSQTLSFLCFATFIQFTLGQDLCWHTTSLRKAFILWCEPKQSTISTWWMAVCTNSGGVPKPCTDSLVCSTSGNAATLTNSSDTKTLALPGQEMRVRHAFFHHDRQRPKRLS